MYGLTFPILTDNQGLYSRFGDGYIPYNVILDKDMVVRYSTSGFSENFIRIQIQNLINQIPTGIKDNEHVGINPDQFKMLSLYPNPFNSSAKIVFYLENADNISLKVYNVSGKEIFYLFEKEYFSKGFHEVSLKGDRLTSGVYFITLSTSKTKRSTKFIYLK